MDFSRFDRYSRLLLGAVILVALLTYWRFRGLEPSGVYAFVAQHDVRHLLFLRGFNLGRPIIWDFFGMIDRVFNPHAIVLLKVLSFMFVLLDLVMLYGLVSQGLKERFWGFLCVFMLALSPFAVVSAASGDSAAVAVTIALLFLAALYNGRYIFGGLISAIGFAAGLPGLIMFLIVLLDLLQKLKDKSVLVTRLLLSAAVFFASALVIYIYSVHAGSSDIFFLPFTGSSFGWTFVGAVPLLLVDMVSIAGVIFLVRGKRFDIYTAHFHTLMLWITSSAFCLAQPNLLNLFFTFTISSVTAIIFLREFVLRWNLKLVTADTFLLLFATVFIFTDLFANNRFVLDKVLTDSIQETEAANEVAAAILSKVSDARIVTNFVPAELAVKLGTPVYETGSDPIGLTQIAKSDRRTVFVVKGGSNQPTIPIECKLLYKTSYIEGRIASYVHVLETGEVK